MKALLLLLAMHGQVANVGKVSSLIQKDVVGVPNKECLMLQVDIAPGETVPTHRHNASVFAYVLQGTITTQIQGEAIQTLHAGQAFYESPADVHLPSHNPSKKVTARLLVVFVKDKGVPPTVVLNSSPH